MKHFDIRLTPQELDVVANALSNGPWNQVNALLVNIKAQVDMQQRIDQTHPVSTAEVVAAMQPNGLDTQPIN